MDGDAFDLLVETLHAVAETRGRRLGYRDGYQDGLGHRRLRDTNTHTHTAAVNMESMLADVAASKKTAATDITNTNIFCIFLGLLLQPTQEITAALCCTPKYP